MTPFDPSVVTLEAAPDLVLPVDSDDANPNVPVQSVVTVPAPIVTGWTFGPDTDRDAVPSTVILSKARYTFDRRVISPPVTTSAAPSDTYRLDTDDANKNVPVQSVQ